MENKNKHILITLLTSNNISFLKGSYNSIMEQKKIAMHYTLVIIVNTLDSEYYNKVIQEFPNMSIIQTESNGGPGKGHNSVITYFKNHPEYDYVITLDGDDFLYPYALHNLEKYIHHYNPDVLLLPFNDQLETSDSMHPFNYPISNKCFLRYNLDKIDILPQVRPTANPFTSSKISTPGRLIFLSRNALHMNLLYSENVKMLDDIYLCAQILEYNTISSKYNIYFVELYDFYLYNSLNTQSVSNKMIHDIQSNKNKEVKLCKNNLKDKFFSIRNWNLKSIKIAYIPNQKNQFSFSDKIKWVTNLVHTLELPNITHMQCNMKLRYTYMMEKNLKDIADMYI